MHCGLRDEPGWGLVIPVKELTRAKSRLPGPPAARARTALALALDTLAAAARCPLVSSLIVVTDDPVAGRLLAGTAMVVPDRPRAGLSAAVEYGSVLARAGEPFRPVAALTSDLPALTAPGLTRVLQAAHGLGRAVVADALGTGTVLLSATGGLPLTARFEGASRVAHLRAGAADLTALAPPGLRRDVDTLEDLRAALQLAPAPHTRVAAQAAGWVP